ncbi:MAG TPA: MauE/DoxX family redox-associated membrane protein [Gemmataceae bacterium]|jgi:uncharacterized membrane protein YphA (DoxX/SURF4 family)|nr:MauE/DoxX family redox-associated membrane protein [Gemmataceae bacterium]
MGYPAPTADKQTAPRGWWRASGLVCRYMLACVFLMAALTKVTDLHSFSNLVQARSGLPHQVALSIGAFLPWLELTCAACLLSGKTVREAGLILTVLLFALLVYALGHLSEPDCGCWVFPTLGTESVWWWPAARNCLLLLCGLRVAWK